MSNKKKKNGNLGNNSWLNFLDTVTSIIIVPILVLSIVCSVVMINAKRNNNVPNIFGFSLVTILSTSMTNSGFEVDESVMVKQADPAEIEVGDIIAYYKYIEPIKESLSQIAQSSMGSHSASASEAVSQDYPTFSKVSSWRLYLNKLFSNLTYTSTEASEKAIRSKSPIIFHQVVDIVDYEGYLWFRTWGTSNLDTRGDPVYDTYWIREDYVIGRYTHTSSTVRAFLSFASTNTGILWMVEVPSGVHLVLSTLELVEILDMMTKERHERIKNGTYIDRKEYKKMLRVKRKMLASGNIDIELFKKLYPNYANFEIIYSEDENNKHNVNINGPPDSNGFADTKASLYGTGATSKIGESPPRGRAPNGRDGPPGDQGESPPNRGGPPSGESPPSAVGPPNKESPPNNAVGPPNKESPPNNAVGPPNKESPPNKNGPPNNKGDTNGQSPPGSSGYSAEDSNLKAGAEKIRPKIDKSLFAVSTGGLYDSEDRKTEEKSLHDLQTQTETINHKTKTKLAKNEVMLTHEELLEMTDIYSSAFVDFIANTDITNKGVVSKPDKKNKIYLVSKKTKRQFSLEKLGIIYSVNSGLITTESGIYKPILSTNGADFELLKVDPKFTIISAKQDGFGNVFIGVTGGETSEITYKTSDGKLVSIWNRNALLTLGEDFKLYYISMDKSFDLNKGVITDLKVMSKEGKLVSVTKVAKTIKFIDGFEKYGFMSLTPEALVLDKGRMLFILENKLTIKLTPSQWVTNDSHVVEHNTATKQVKQFTMSQFVGLYQGGSRVDDDSGGVVLAENVKQVTETDNAVNIVAGNGDNITVKLLE